MTSPRNGDCSYSCPRLPGGSSFLCLDPGKFFWFNDSLVGDGGSFRRVPTIQVTISTPYQALTCVGESSQLKDSPRKQCFPRPSLPCVPTSASASPPRPSPRRELSCPWRRLTAWKLFSSSRLKTKMTASAQPENLRGVREQKGEVRQVYSSGHYDQGVLGNQSFLP